jgi:hypothetical protein
MLSKLKVIVLIMSLAVLAWSCATIMHGTSQKIGISSSPSGAKVIVDNADFGATPTFAELKRGDDHIVKISLEGYQTAELTITKSVSGWVWGNIVFGGLIGLAVDAISGGLYNLSPEQLNAELKKNGFGYIDNEKGIYIFTVLQPNKEWQKIGNLKTTSN